MPEAGVSVRALPLFLFTAGDTAGSLAAYGNIRLALEMFPPGNFALEVFDVWSDTDKALEHRVLVTPTLLAPSCERRLVGDLSKWSVVHHFLQSLRRAESTP